MNCDKAPPLLSGLLWNLNNKLVSRQIFLPSFVQAGWFRVAYIVAFTIELWWILEAEVTLPTPAYLLCAGYFITFVVSALLLHGITVKRTLFLLSWLFTIVILSFPEAGLVLFMSLHYWKVKSLYGLTELIYWSCRVICNIAGLICVQSLYSTWREEKIVLQRLHDLNMSNINRSLPSNGHLKNGNGSPGYQNGGFITSTNRLNMLSSSVPAISRHQRSASLVSHLHLQSPLRFGGSLPNNNTTTTHMIPLTPLNNLQYAFFGTQDSGTTGSEFNASTFDGYFAASLSSNMVESEKLFHPQLNIHRNHFGTPMNRTQSLVDLRDSAKLDNLWFSAMPLDALSVDYMHSKPAHVTQSLDRRVLRHSGKLRKACSLSELSNIGRFTNITTAYDDIGAGHVQRVFMPPFPYHLYRRPRPIVQSCGSKRSLAESDDMQKIRDVAL